MANNNNKQNAVNEELERLQAMLDEKEKQAAEAQAKLTEKEKQLADTQAKLAEKEKQAEETNTTAAPKHKMVKIKLPRIRKDDDDVFVSVNNYTCMIQRGVEVEVPDFVAEVLQHQEQMLLLR